MQTIKLFIIFYITIGYIILAEGGQRCEAQTGPATLSTEERNLAEQINLLYARATQIVLPAVVRLHVINLPEAVAKGEPAEATGSGCLLAQKGYLITAHHVIANAESIEVIFGDGSRFRAEKRMEDPDTELAVLRFDPGDKDMPAITWGDSEKMAAGMPVLVIGAPYAFEQTVTSGVVSFKGRRINKLGEWAYEDFIQTDAAINKGNSGGPLVNLFGEVVGVTSLIYDPSREGRFAGYGFAVPSNLARFVAEELAAKGYVRRGWLGLELCNVPLEQLRHLRPEDSLARSNDILSRNLGWLAKLDKQVQGVLVLGVFPEGPSAIGGVRPRDIIQKINGVEVITSKQIQYLIARTPPETQVIMDIWRNGGNVTLPVTLGDRRSVQEQPLNHGQDARGTGCIKEQQR
ncbi:MAG: trypsin-like peptidase domain-containing protein [Sedimentisphaerales bacterium]|nr:trypsin-like peptidase domain-containing protein [Sedimentisphaerales bacterium]